MWISFPDHRESFRRIHRWINGGIPALPQIGGRSRPGVFAVQAGLMFLALLLPGTAALRPGAKADEMRLPADSEEFKLESGESKPEPLPELIARLPGEWETVEFIRAMPWQPRPEPIPFPEPESERIRERPWIEADEPPEMIRRLPRLESSDKPELIESEPKIEAILERINSDPHLEDDLMTRAKPMAIPATFLLGWFLAVPPAVYGGDEPPKLPTPGEFADLLGKINRKLEDLPAMKAQLDGFEKRLEKLESLSLQIENGNKSVKDALAEMKTLREDIARIQSDLKKMQALAETIEKYKAFSPPNPPVNGTISLVNDWNSRMVVVIDNEFIRLEPGERRTVTKPAGGFKYEVLGVQGLVTRNVEAGKTFTIRIGAP